MEEIAVGVHITAATVKKYLDSLVTKKLVNEVFLLQVPPSAFVVYAYLLLIEDRRTHTRHPSYNTIAAATGLAKNTAMKSVSTLLEMGLIAVEPSSYFDKCGMKEQDKRVASYAAPPPTSARSAGSLQGTRVGSQTQKKSQIKVAQRLYPLVSRLWDDVFGPKKRDYDGYQK